MPGPPSGPGDLAPFESMRPEHLPPAAAFAEPPRPPIPVLLALSAAILVADWWTKRWATAQAEKNFQVLVFIGKRTIAILPDRDVDLGD